MEKRRLITIFVIVFVDLLGFGLILPLLPYYADRYGATPFVVGLLTASYAAAQLVGAPVLGRLSDRHGRRPVLLVSIAGTAVSLLLLGLAEPLGTWLAGLLLPSSLSGQELATATNIIILAILFTSRILDGITGGNISVAQAYITDITDEENRAQGLGLIGAAFGLGFIIGPAVGGVLSAGGRFAIPAFFAAALAFLNWIAVYLWLPESLTDEIKAQLAKQPARAIFSLTELWQAMKRPRFGPLLHVRLWYGLAFATFTGVFALYAQYRLELDATQTGYLLAYVGLLTVLVQGLAIGRLTRRFPENRLIFGAVIVLAVSLLGWAFAPNVPLLLIVLAPIAFAAGVLNTVINSAITKSVYHEEVGGALGVATSIESLTRVIGPAAGGFVLGALGTWAPGVIGALIMAWLISFVWRRLIVNPDPPLPGRGDEAVAEEVAQAHP
ncbi:MAG: MFS transporter [Anaerolineae bacterium]|jgi:DHA1 family tetracycline resistance protein-like MFS transporter